MKTRLFNAAHCAIALVLFAASAPSQAMLKRVVTTVKTAQRALYKSQTLQPSFNLHGLRSASAVITAAHKKYTKTTQPLLPYAAIALAGAATATTVFCDDTRGVRVFATPAEGETASTVCVTDLKKAKQTLPNEHLTLPTPQQVDLALAHFKQPLTQTLVVDLLTDHNTSTHHLWHQLPRTNQEALIKKIRSQKILENMSTEQLQKIDPSALQLVFECESEKALAGICTALLESRFEDLKDTQVVAFLTFLSDEKALRKTIEKAIETGRLWVLLYYAQDDASVFYQEEAMNRIALLILNNYFETVGFSVNRYCLRFLSDQAAVKEWSAKLYKQLTDPLYQFKDASGPLFCHETTNYFITQNNKESRPGLQPGKENFEALLWEIAEYVNQEYQKDRIVLFHGHHSYRMFLERCFNELYTLRYNTQTPDSFRWLRFREKDFLKRERCYDNLFTNLHLFANELGENSWFYASSNTDNSKRAYFDSGEDDWNSVHKDLENLFYIVGLSEEFETLSEKGVFKKLFPLFRDAVQDQGNYGELLVISMPKTIARPLVYLCGKYADSEPMSINEIRTKDVVTIAENYATVRDSNQFCLQLDARTCYPEKARSPEVDVKIVGFDPAMHQRTEKYLLFEAELKNIMAQAKELYETRKKTEKETPSKNNKENYNE